MKRIVILEESQVNSLRFSLTLACRELQAERKELKKYKALHYELCDKDKPETADYFETFNKLKAELKANRKLEKTYNNLQRSLKASPACEVPSGSSIIVSHGGCLLQYED